MKNLNIWISNIENIRKKLFNPEINCEDFMNKNQRM